VSRREPPNEAQPVVQRIRIRYTKTGRMRFASHRDFQRALERAVRRSGFPIAFSGGFNPHPRISYANAAPTGTASRAEYVELGLGSAVDPDAVAATLSAALPDGFAVAQGVLATPGALADRLEVSEWLLEFSGVSGPAVADSVARLESAGQVTVDRMTKNGMRPIAVGESWLCAAVEEAAEGGVALRVITRLMIPTVRPDDLLNALVEHGGLARPAAALSTRLAQGPLLAGPSVGDPLA
jgi:radical SAM-linked protein